ncbi:hypothetical protein C7212DRAFT_345379 [Tuber magnatum]|uniref:Uncharacterized protein n=1 Tax=Tuber magnatum TaxID=42249 RepID=A0A317SPL6_9PEZI|nr:hypothetical protein C7212DRAFT_345379 [Tuber magnatum]
MRGKPPLAAPGIPKNKRTILSSKYLTPSGVTVADAMQRGAEDFVLLRYLNHPPLGALTRAQMTQVDGGRKYIAWLELAAHWTSGPVGECGFLPLPQIFSVSSADSFEFCPSYLSQFLPLYSRGRVEAGHCGDLSHPALSIVLANCIPPFPIGKILVSLTNIPKHNYLYTDIIDNYFAIPYDYRTLL